MPGPSGECTGCRKKRLQRKAANQAETSAVPPIVREVLATTGQPLDPATRAFMEPHFGHDFSRVRVHTGAKAAASARAINALAYTVGRAVMFGAGQYGPQTGAGKRLLAHELAHVVQQNDALSACSGPRAMNTPGSSEKEAKNVSARLMAGALVAEVNERPGNLIQRQPIPELHSSKRRPGQTLPYREAMEEIARERLSGTSLAQLLAQPLPQSRTRAPSGTAGIHGGVQYTVYEISVRARGSRAWRNNNPGNLVPGRQAEGNGAIGSDGRFAIFPDEATGMDALIALLRTGTYQALTVEGAMVRYAPPRENDTSGYISFIQRQTGLDPKLKMSSLTDAQLRAVAGAIRTFEGWILGDIYTCDTTAAPDWVRSSLGCPTPGPNTSREPEPQVGSPGIPVPNRDKPGDVIHE